jgi:hypothetical protein
MAKKLTFAQLDRAARMIAHTAPPDDREDVYQDAWVMFLRWPPRFMGHAVTMARNARNAIWRKRHQGSGSGHRGQERQQIALDGIAEPAWRGHDPTADEVIARDEIAEVPPEIVRLGILSEQGVLGEKNRPTGTARAKLSRWRKEQVPKVAKVEAPPPTRLKVCKNGLHLYLGRRCEPCTLVRQRRWWHKHHLRKEPKPLSTDTRATYMREYMRRWRKGEKG